MKFSKSLLGLALVVATSGCSGLYDCVEGHANTIHSELTAHEAWARWSWCYDQLDHPKDFASGFRAGYQDILNGGNGCQPTLPPRHYWKSCFRNAEGHCRVNAWFAGFAHGAIAAEQDGAAAYGFIPISPTAQANLATASQPPAEYDWSAQAPPAPGPAEMGLEPTPLPPDPTQPGVENPPVDPEGTYEQPVIRKPVQTTGRATLENSGN